MTTITGGCLCKRVRFEITAQPMVMRLCWCRDCQYWASGNATVNLVFPSNAIRIQGEPRDYQSVAQSGSRMHRRFCPDCGTHLFSEAEARPHLIIVRAGSLDDREIAKPDANIWTASAPSWACVNASLTEFKGQPPPAA